MKNVYYKIFNREPSHKSCQSNNNTKSPSTDTANQTEVIPKTWPQEEITPQNNHNTSKSFPNNANGPKSGNNPSLKLNKENVKKKTLIVGNSMVKDIDGWHLSKRMRSTVSVRSVPGATTKGMIHHVKGCLEDTSPDFIYTMVRMI